MFPVKVCVILSTMVIFNQAAILNYNNQVKNSYNKLLPPIGSFSNGFTGLHKSQDSLSPIVPYIPDLIYLNLIKYSKNETMLTTKKDLNNSTGITQPSPVAISVSTDTPLTTPIPIPTVTYSTDTSKITQMTQPTPLKPKYTTNTLPSSPSTTIDSKYTTGITQPSPVTISVSTDTPLTGPISIPTVTYSTDTSKITQMTQPTPLEPKYTTNTLPTSHIY